MVKDPSCSRNAGYLAGFVRTQSPARCAEPFRVGLKRFVAAGIVLSLLLTGPGFSELWAAVADDVPGGGHVTVNGNLGPVAQTPQAYLGGSSFGPAVVPNAVLPQGTQLPGKVLLPVTSQGSVQGQSLSSVASGAEGDVSPAAGLESTAEGSGAPTAVLGSESRDAVAHTARELGSDRIGSLSSEDVQNDGNKLQALIEGRPSAAPAGSLPVQAGTYQVASHSNGVSAAVATGKASSDASNGILPVPAAGSAEDQPGNLRVQLFHARLWLQSFKHYFIDINVENWREYRARREQALAAKAQPAVGDARGLFTALDDFELAMPANSRSFFAATRLMGMVGGYQIVGSRSGSDAYVTTQALAVFDDYFKTPGVTPQARGAFMSFLGRATRFNPGRRSSNLRKQIRKALQSASLEAPASLESFFDAQMPDVAAANKIQAQFQGSEQANIVAAFRRAVAETVNEEAAGAGRVVGVVVLGSFANSAATATSDFDLQILTADGDSARVEPFLARLQARWAPAGQVQPNPINATPFAFAPLRGLLLCIHRERYFVVSPDAELERALSPPAGYFEANTRPDASTWQENLARSACGLVLKAVLPLVDLKDSLQGQASSGLDEKTRKKALTGWLVARTLYLAGFVLSGLIAFPILANEVVGRQGYSDLMSLGSLAAIGLASFSGVIVDKLSYRNTFALNTAVRLLVAAATPVLYLTHHLSFWPMLAVSLVNGWNISSSLIAEDKLMPVLAGSDGKKLSVINAAANLNFIALNVILGIFLGAGTWVDALMTHFGKLPGLSIVFAANAALCAAGFVIQWFTIPNARLQKPAAAVSAAAAPEKKALKTVMWGLVLAAGVSLYHSLHGYVPQFATLPFVALMLGGLVATSDGFLQIWKNSVLRTGALLGTLYAFVIYPVQSMMIPFAAADLKGGAHLQGELQGSLFFGQLLSGSTLLNLPGGIRIFGRSVSWNSIVRGAVLGAFAIWLPFYLFPHSLLAAAGSMAGVLGLYTASAHLTDRGWMRYAFTGLMFIALPLLFWGKIPVLLLSILMIGLVNSPNKITIDTVTQREAKESDPENAGRIMGVRSALINIATAFGYASFGAVTKAFHPAFPGSLAPMVVLFGVVGFLLWLAPRWLGKRISASDFKPGSWLPWTANGPVVPALRIGARRATAALAAGWLGAAAAAAPGLSREDLKSLLAQRFKTEGIKAVVVDYDGTLMDKTSDNKAVPASEELVSLIKALRAYGIQVVISTNHYFDGDGNSMTSLLGDRLDAQTRAGMMFVTQSGSKIFEYGPNGEKPAEALWTQSQFDDAERARITPAFEAAAKSAGLSPEDYKIFYEDSRTLIEVRGKQERAEAVYAALAEANTKNGWGYIAQLKPMPTMRQVPYVQFAKANKGTGTKQAFELLRSRNVVTTGKQLLIMGDAFEPEGNDLTMAQALPGATAIAVGSPSEARQPNVFQSAKTGATATHDVFRDLLELLSAAKAQ